MPDFEAILNQVMDEHDLNTDEPVTIKDYLMSLLSQLWHAKSSFSGKRPFGNSGWEFDVYRALIMGRHIRGTITRDGDFQNWNQHEADELIENAIAYMAA